MLAIFQQLKLGPDFWLRRQQVGTTAELYTVFVKHRVQISFTVYLGCFLEMSHKFLQPNPYS
jgi:hypothetical protein